MDRSLICIIVFTVIGFVLFLLGVILGWAVFPPLVRQQIIDNVVLKEGTDQFDRFLELPQPLHFKVYIFNVTNPEEVMNNGALPVVQEVGPYYYRQYRRKHDVVLSGDDRNITFVQESEFQYDHRRSAPLSQDDPIFVLSLHINSVLLEVESTMEIMLETINQAVDFIFGPNSSMIMRTTPRQFLFEGIEFCWPGVHPLSDIVCNIVKQQMTDAMQILPDGTLSFAMFRHKNMTNNGVFKVHSGVEEPRDTQQIITWQGKTDNDVWPDNEDNTSSVCNMIRGSDGAAFRPLQETGETAFIFNTDICRTVQLEFNGEAEYEGIPGFKYAASPYFLDQIGPEYNNSCFCVNQIPGGIVQENGCLYPGALDLSPCQGAPLVLTKPHLLGADHYQQFVHGLSPDPDKHQIDVLVEPHLGIPLRANSRVQFNQFLRPIPHITITQQLAQSFVPILWVDEGIALGEDLVDMIRSDLVDVLVILDAVHWTLFAVGLALFVAMLTWLIVALVKRRGKTQVGSFSPKTM
ncbi:sensory neuron membrane protein 2 [Phlebotomus argentipes]|uniref:sensory neuron membrane protein 2 n=1 Tax=Phlebotomus argentipes TaxID=94469 RepID=UPI002892A8ED|nr:sensory neuron membrane protein 2 [Phlebotomus argentipes]XP_059614473.1 sensory neuron membrane protein 2 [Phlebotomus argentipes]XP_059614474.1 sensory neuron membrane protein 2 [Phlebotomus argentipes]XP_059614475.1 sensory neuron membrane protein 2 [Phlebotomus argentipes]